MGRRLRLVVPMSNPAAGPVVVIPRAAYDVALRLAGGNRRHLEIRPGPAHVLAEIVVHNRPHR